MPRPRRTLPKGAVALADIAREIGMDPKTARARFRRNRASLAAHGLKPKWGRWVFEAKLRDKIVAALRGRPPGVTLYTARLRQVGGSMMIAIPPPLLAALHLDAEADVELSLDAGRLIIQPRERPLYTLDELLARCDPSAPLLPEDREWLDVAPTGRELI